MEMEMEKIKEMEIEEAFKSLLNWFFAVLRIFPL